MKKVFAFIVCAVALVMSSLVASHFVCDIEPNKQIAHGQIDASQSVLNPEDNTFEWSYTSAAFSSPTANGVAGLTKRPSGPNSPRQQSEPDLYLIQNHGDLCTEQASANPIRNFVAFRHHNQPRYYIFDLHRIRI